MKLLLGIKEVIKGESSRDLFKKMGNSSKDLFKNMGESSRNLLGGKKMGDSSRDLLKIGEI